MFSGKTFPPEQDFSFFEFHSILELLEELEELELLENDSRLMTHDFSLFTILFSLLIKLLRGFGRDEGSRR